MSLDGTVVLGTRKWPLGSVSWTSVKAFSSSSTRLASASSIPTPPHVTRLPDPNSDAPAQGKKLAERAETLERVRQWVEKFKVLDVTALREAKGVEMTFSRSSGPGGQNVNKVNTKATVRCSVDVPWIPAWAKAVLVQDVSRLSYQRFTKPHYASSSHSILVTSTVTRSQAQNIDDCLEKIHSIILSASTAELKNQTPEETKKRVEAHIKAEKAKRRSEKEYRSSVRKGRAGGARGGFDSY